MQLIKDLYGMENVSAKWIEAFENYIPQWLETLIPHYKVAKELDADILCLVNNMYMGKTPEDIVVNGVHYYFTDTLLFGKTLSFNSNHAYYPFNWEDGFKKVYPEDMNDSTRFSDWMHTHHHLWRFLNRKQPYNEFSKRVETLFRQMVGDDSILFDFGCTSYIIFNHSLKQSIDKRFEA